MNACDDCMYLTECPARPPGSHGMMRHSNCDNVGGLKVTSILLPHPRVLTYEEVRRLLSDVGSNHYEPKIALLKLL